MELPSRPSVIPALNPEPILRRLPRGFMPLTLEKVRRLPEAVGRHRASRFGVDLRHDARRGQAAVVTVGVQQHAHIGLRQHSHRNLAVAEAAGMIVLIPSRSNSLNPRTYDPAIYRERNQIERLFNRLKNCRRVASRYEKTARNYRAMLQIAGSMLWLAYMSRVPTFWSPQTPSSCRVQGSA